MADIPGNSSTTATISVGGTVTGELETVADHDWFAISLTAGQPVVVTLNGVTLADPYLYVRDTSGNLLFSNNDMVDGVNRNSQVAFNPTYSGTYYIDVGAFGDALTGTYQLSVQPYTSPPVATIDQIANELTSGYWAGQRHHFDVTQGGTISVNISTLNPGEQSLARSALQSWSDIIGVHFQEVTSGGQIVFDDSEGPNGPVAEAFGQWSNGIISTEHVHISASWVNSYGGALDTYSYQTYIHEIGHALGLGHPGGYNETARYPYDAMFKNDGWPVSVMSYFSQSDNSYYGYSEQFVLTPMAADIVAMQSLYGLSTTTRTGDTTYGYHSNAGGIFDAVAYPNAAYTIFDSGGIDTLDFSGCPYGQRINLNPETFSDVNGHNLDLYIARGVTIENAIGGPGDDTITQNGANNILNGGAGTNTLSYETATAGVTIDLRISAAQDTRGAGVDTITNFERVIGTAFADTLIASATTMSLSGGGGDDLIVAGPTTPSGGLGMYGGDGNDVFILGGGSEWIDGGAGYNIVDCSNATAGVLLTTNGHAGAGVDSLVNIQKIVGSNYADTLYSTNSNDVLMGGAGDDTLIGDANLAGGSGNDTYQVSSAAHITEYAGEGIDTVIARGSYTLGANLENLTLFELHSSDPYAGAAVPPPNQPEDWNATGNELANVIIGNQGNNVLAGLDGDDTLTGGAGADILTGGAGNDTFKDTAAGLNGDTITDFSVGDTIIITDRNFATFSFSMSGHTLNYTGGSLTLSNLPAGELVAKAGVAGSVQIALALSGAPSASDSDFNGDGRTDILWRSDSGLVTDWLSTGSSFYGNSANFLAQLDPAWQIAGTGDFNGDGRVDLLWRSASGLVTDWLSDQSGGFYGNSGNFLAQLDASWHIAATGDFNGDGRSDILWRSDSGLITDWLADGSGHSFYGNSGTFLTQLDWSWQVAGSGDFNGDGIDDLLLRKNDGTVVDWLGQPNGEFVTNAGTFQAQVGTTWHIVGTGDFNGDGVTDILWRSDSGQVTDWLASGDGSFYGNSANFLAQVSTTSNVAQVGDFNGDGIDDILWRSAEGSLTNWFGQSNGSFAVNAGFGAQIDNSWHIQPHEVFL